MINCPTAKFCRRKRNGTVEWRSGCGGVGGWSGGVVWVWLTEGGKLPNSANERGWEHKKSERWRERGQRRCWSAGNVTMWQQGDVGERKTPVGQIEEEKQRELASVSLMCCSSSLDSLKYSFHIHDSLPVLFCACVCVCVLRHRCVKACDPSHRQTY